MLIKTTNKKVEISMFDSIVMKSTVVPFSVWRNKYDFISIVCLNTGCDICYEKYIEWNKKMSELEHGSNYTTLFIIKGEEYKSFFNDVDKIEPVDFRYSIVSDSNYLFVNNNTHLSYWVFEKYPLIDNKNKIKFLGLPYRDMQHSKLFLDVINKNRYKSDE